MKEIRADGKSYEVDDRFFLIDPDQWDDNFARAVAGEIGIGKLTDDHWRVIRYIRESFREKGACPVVFETCRSLGLTAKALQNLFPTGYLRGACLLAGISYKYGWVYFDEEPYAVAGERKEKHRRPVPTDKVYRVDVFGSLVDPEEWDENFALRRAYEMNIRGGLTEKHWKIINFLRGYYIRFDEIPTIYDCCQENGIEIDELARLFPTGYHRGAVKIAGLPTLK